MTAFPFFVNLVLHLTQVPQCAAGFSILPRCVAENKNICQPCFYNSNNDNSNPFILLCPLGLWATVLHCPRHRSLARSRALQADSQSILFRLVLATLSWKKGFPSSQRPDADDKETRSYSASPVAPLVPKYWPRCSSWLNLIDKLTQYFTQRMLGTSQLLWQPLSSITGYVAEA